MRVVGVLGTKGGAGKTTLCTALAVRASAESSVAVVDLDPQASTSSWWERRGKPDNPTLYRGADRASEAVEALTLTSPHDYVFFDGPPGSVITTQDAVDVSSVVVMPIRASALDIGASADLLTMCEAAGVPVLAVINDLGQHDSKLADNARALLVSWGVEVAATVVKHRSQYINAVTTGAVGPEKDREARREIDALWGEVLAVVKRVAVPA